MKKRILSLILSVSVVLSATGLCFSAGAESAVAAAGNRAPAYQSVYEAESAVVMDAETATTLDDYSGDGYVSSMAGGGSVTFRVNAPESGRYGVRLRYTNGSSADMSIPVYLNGEKVADAALTKTVSWDTWDECLVALELTAGENTISYNNESGTADLANLDKITLSRLYEGEAGVMSGSGLKIGRDHTGYSGTGFAAGFERDGDTLTYTVNAPAAGQYTVNTHYANGNGSSGSRWIWLEVNGEQQKLGLADTRSWDAWLDFDASVTLQEGENTISYVKNSEVNGGVNIDYMTVTPAHWIYAGAVEDVEGNGSSELTFVLDNASVRINSVGDNSVKVWLEPSGRFERKYESFAETNDAVDPQKLTAVSKGDCYEVDAGDMILRIQKDPFKITYLDKSGNVLMENENDSMGWTEDGQLTVNNKIDEDEAFWGLGEVNGEYNRRGQRKVMWSVDIVGAAMDSAFPDWDEGRSDLVQPYYVSSNGYSILYDNASYSVFDMGQTVEDTVTFGSYNPYPAGDLIYYFTYGPSVKQITKTLTDIIGKSFFAPDWAYGNMQCHWGYKQSDIEEVAETYREYEIPLDVMVADIDWYQDKCNPVKWNTANFPDPESMISKLNAMGIRMGVIDDPNITAVEADLAEFREADENGFFLKTQNGETKLVTWPWGSHSGLVDFLNPAVRTWWADLHDMIIGQGVEYMWQDMNEPSAYNIDWLFWNEDGKAYGTIGDVKNAYANFHNMSMYEKYTEDGSRAFLQTRGGFIGNQKYAAPWTGDIGSGYQYMAEQITFAAGLGLSGYYYWGFDIGGFNGTVTNDQFKRWVELACFTPVHRFHYIAGKANQEAYTHDAADVSREYINLRYRLMPYAYSQTADSIIGIGIEEGLGDGGTGLPYTRAMSMEYPEDKNTWNLDSQFMAGGNFLIAPVVEEAVTKEVYFPEGYWYDYSDGQTVYEGGRTVDYDAPIEKLPVFVKAGSIIPMQPVMQYVGEKPVDELTLDIYPTVENGDFHFVMYEDDGESQDYQNGEYTTTRYDASVIRTGDNQTITLNIGARTGSFTDIDERNYMMQFHGAGYSDVTATAGGATLTEYASLEELNAAAAGFYSDRTTGICYVKIDDTKAAATVVVSGNVTDEIILEAETAVLAGGASVATEVRGFSGTGYAAGLSGAADSISFENVEILKDGRYSLYLNYFAEQASAVTVQVDGGEIVTVDLPAADKWTEKAAVFELTAGTHSIKISGVSGAASIDRVLIPFATFTVSGVSELWSQAEDGVLKGGASVMSSNSGYTGSGYVGGFDSAGDGVVIENVMAMRTGTYAVKIRYNCTTAGNSLRIYTGENAANAVTVNFPVLKGNGNWQDMYVNLEMEAGYNTITIERGTGAGNVRIDRVTCPLETGVMEQITLANGGFESGNTSNWTVERENGTPSDYGVNDDDALFGNNKLYFWANNRVQTIRRTETVENGTYLVDAFVKSYIFTNNDAVSVKIIIDQFDGDNSIVTDVSIDSVWNRYMIPVEVKDGTVRITFKFDNMTQDWMSLQVDEVSLWKTEESAASSGATLLDAEIAAAEELTSGSYTVDSLRNLLSALAYAKQTAADSASSNSDLAAALVFLQRAEKALVVQTEPEFLLGDLNADDSINVLDVVALRQIIMTGQPTDDRLMRGDIDANGTLNVSDVVALRIMIMNA